MITKHASQTIKKILSTRSSHRLRTSTALRGYQPSSSTSPQLLVHGRLSLCSRSFQTESDYHNKADDTLQTIQDTLDFYFEDNPEFGSSDINYASGVLTIALADKGTWVLNKQTPNRQIWWSSPITGPRRYEFSANDGNDDEKWVWSRYIDFENSGANAKEWNDTKYLGESLKKEMVDLFHVEDGLEDLDDL